MYNEEVLVLEQGSECLDLNFSSSVLEICLDSVGLDLELVVLSLELEFERLNTPFEGLAVRKTPNFNLLACLDLDLQGPNNFSEFVVVKDYNGLVIFMCRG